MLRDAAGSEQEPEAGCEALFFIGFAYQRRGWVEEASLAYQTAVDRYPLAESAVREVIELLGAARGGAIVPAVITNLERKERDASLDLARLYARPDVGRFEDAHAVLDALERRHPDDRDVLESRCRVFLAQGRVDDAEKLRAKLDR